MEMFEGLYDPTYKELTEEAKAGLLRLYRELGEAAAQYGLTAMDVAAEAEGLGWTSNQAVLVEGVADTPYSPFF